LGPPGKPGDPTLILRAVNRLVVTCESFLDAEIEMSALEPPPELSTLVSTLQGMTLGVIDEVSRIPNEIEAVTQGTWEGGREASIKLVFEAPPQLQSFLAELELLKSRGWSSQ
jgi:hypothetical protein